MNILDDEKDLLLDHEYDGIKELDNHMPVWWLWLFYFTIAWGVGYMAYYYVFGGPSQEELYEMEMAAAEEQYNLNEDSGTEPDGAGDFTFAYLDDEERIAEGKEIFMSNNNLCYTCHGSNGEGMVGPNLADNLWIHGCSADEVAASIKNGFPDRGMIAYGSGAPLNNEQLQSLISYIGSLQGTEPEGAKAPDMARAEPCTIQ